MTRNQNRDGPERDGALESYVDAFRADIEVSVDTDRAWHRFTAQQGRRSRARVLVVASMVGVAALLAAAVLLRISTPAQQLEPLPPHAASHLRGSDRPELVWVEERAPVAVRAVKEQVDFEPTPQDGVSEQPLLTGTTRPSRGEPRPSRREARPADEAEGSSRLAEELRLIKAMQAALRSGQPGVALRRFSEHAQAFPHSAFEEECQLARARALCALRDFDALQATQSAFERTHPSSHLLPLVRSICEQLDHDEPSPTTSP